MAPNDDILLYYSYSYLIFQLHFSGESKLVWIVSDIQTFFNALMRDKLNVHPQHAVCFECFFRAIKKPSGSRIRFCAFSPGVAGDV